MAKHTVNSAYQAASKQLNADKAISSVVVEFVIATGATKYLKVDRNDNVDVFDTAEQASA